MINSKDRNLHTVTIIWMKWKEMRHCHVHQKAWSDWYVTQNKYLRILIDPVKKEKHSFTTRTKQKRKNAEENSYFVRFSSKTHRVFVANRKIYDTKSELSWRSQWIVHTEFLLSAIILLSPKRNSKYQNERRVTKSMEHMENSLITIRKKTTAWAHHPLWEGTFYFYIKKESHKR